MKPQEYAKEVIENEASAVSGLLARLNESFDQAVELILNCQGRVIVTGMGKSGLIGKKIAATFNSTGISSFFLHPAEALHGDIGLIRTGDILLIISKSGQLDELETVISTIRRLSIKIIALCGTAGSPLDKRADISIDCSVDKEACPNNLVPTSSSTATLVMGDAIAVALLHARNFSSDDFAQLHPGGYIGQRLLKRVSEIHHTGDEVPIVSNDALFSDVMIEMTSKRLGCVFTVNGDNKVQAIFTDGDLRRLMQNENDVHKMTAKEMMHQAPKTISTEAIIDAALALMEEHSITQLATVDENGCLVGVVHLHDILKTKLV